MAGLIGPLHQVSWAERSGAPTAERMIQSRQQRNPKDYRVITKVLTPCGRGEVRFGSKIRFREGLLVQQEAGLSGAEIIAAGVLPVCDRAAPVSRSGNLARPPPRGPGGQGRKESIEC